MSEEEKNYHPEIVTAEPRYKRIERAGKGKVRQLYRDTATDDLLGPIGTIAGYLGVHSGTIEKYIGNLEPKFHDEAGQPVFGVTEIRRILDPLLKKPRVEKETQLYTNEQGKSYATSAYFIERFQLGQYHTFYKLAVDTPTIDGRDVHGQPCDLYEIDDFIKKNATFLSRKPLSGKTQAYIDENGAEWGYPKYFFRKFNINHGPLLKIVQEKKLTTLPGRRGAHECDLYNIKEVLAAINPAFLAETKFTQVEPGLYADKNGEKWATKTYFVKGAYHIPNDRFEGGIDESIRTTNIRGKNKEGSTLLYHVNDTLEVFRDAIVIKKAKVDGTYTDESGNFASQTYFKKRYGISRNSFLERTKKIDPRIDVNDHTGHSAPLYRIDEVIPLLGEEYISRYDEKNETSIFGTEENPVAAVGYFLKKYHLDEETFNECTANCKKMDGISPHGSAITLYEIAELENIFKKEIHQLTLNDDGVTYTRNDSTRYAPLIYFIQTYQEEGLTRAILKKHIEGLRPVYCKDDEKTPLYSIDQVTSCLVTFFEKHTVNPETGLWVRESDGSVWTYFTKIRESYPFIQHADFQTLVANFPSLPGRVKGQEVLLYNLSSVGAAIEKLRLQKTTENKELPIPPNNWIAVGNYSSVTQEGDGMAVQLKRPRKWIEKRIKAILIEKPELDKRRCKSPESPTPGDYYPPEMLAELKNKAAEAEEGELIPKIQSEDKKNLRDVIDEVRGGTTELAKKLRSLIQIFGASRCVDLIFKFRPDFRGIPVEYIKGVIADYLGDFLIVKAKFNPGDTEIPAEYLADDNLRAGLYETIKDNCLRYYFDEKRAGTHQAPIEIIYDYIDHISEALGATRSHEIDDVIQDVVTYYDAALTAFHKPEKFVDALSANREFPDINQRINMKELADKKRLLIADEMGLGKSASVIMAKENLNIGCAVVVAPKNVVSTWERYLSDRTAAGGYFKSGQAPRVLVIDGPSAFTGVSADQFDYILISQEKMNERYVPELKRIGFDMLIVDEVHKVKSVTGERTKYLLELAKTVEDDDKYLAMLSGTPVPNKVQDLAIILRLLYPEKFREINDNELVSQIIRGNMAELRSTLLPRMQMKSLEEGIEMPELTENITEVELSELEKEIYQVLLEDDELTATEKMQVLRQVALNPELLDSTPNIEGSKVKAVSIALSEAFGEHDRIVMFVNDYIEGIVRGEQSIVDKLSLPAGVEVKVVHGNISDVERLAIQTKFNTKNGHKILLIVSGQTADVGVDYSGGDRVFFYNEPWTEYQRHQELARVYRPGLQHDLEATTFVTRGTIEEGIHEYIKRKYLAIEKLLRGIPLSELEKMLLKKTEKSNADENLEKNPELAEYYFSSWDKLRRMFGHVKNIGEEKFIDFLQTYGEEYANAYVDIGSRAYQANANRIAGTLIGQFIKERDQHPGDMRILDLASGPEMLKRHIVEEHQKRMVSLDINRHHFKPAGERRVVGSALHLPFGNHSFEYANFALSLHYLNFAPTREQYERTQALAEINRVLKPGGRAVINIIYSLEFKDQTKFAAAANALGFKIVDAYTGEVTVDEQYRSFTVTLEKEHDLETQEPKELTEKIGAENYAGLKFRKNNTKIKNQRKIATSFTIRGQKIEIPLNKEDALVLEEESSVIALAESLKERYRGIKNIPDAEIVTNDFVRVLAGKKYVLFKKLERGSGAVVIK